MNASPNAHPWPTAARNRPVREVVHARPATAAKAAGHTLNGMNAADAAKPASPDTGASAHADGGRAMGDVTNAA